MTQARDSVATEPLLPVHGFVLAGGKSARMGRDKALLPFHRRPMVEIAVQKLRSFCATVSIAGNREDLARFAPVVQETRREAGPGAGIEAGLWACAQPWALFLPVDVPLVPASLLRRWAEMVLSPEGTDCAASYLVVNGERQPAFCMVRLDAREAVTRALDQGEHRLEALLRAAGKGRPGGLWTPEADGFAPEQRARGETTADWFRNLNTPEELAEAEARPGLRSGAEEAEAAGR